jgi:three-Cys-motif partner protein
MLRAYLDHSYRPRMQSLGLNYVFIEKDVRRVQHLNEEVARQTLPANVKVNVVPGAFDEVMTAELGAIAGGRPMAPSFVFIDPFGYKDFSLALSGRILAFPKCELLIYVPWPHVARFIATGKTDQAITNLFGDDTWKPAAALGGKAAEEALHSLFLEKVRQAAGYAASFEIDTTRGRGWSGYTLYFGTSHALGLRKMKNAMWRLDPAAGSGFSYSDNPDQMTFFEPAPDLRTLESSLFGHFADQEFSIGEAEAFVLHRTPFSPDIHLKRGTLKVAEDGGRLLVRNPTGRKRVRGTYPDGTLIKFRPQP